MQGSAFPADSLERRITVGLAIKGGSRGSLTRCVGRLGQYVSRAAKEEKEEAVAVASMEEEETQDNTVMAETARVALEREIHLLHLEMTKTVLQAQRQRAEVDALSLSLNDNETQGNETTDATTTMAKKVQELRHAHVLAQAAAACRLEYEALAKVAVTRYPTSRQSLQQQMETTNTALQQATETLQTLQAEITVRQKQFASLMQCLHDLQQSLQETPLVLEPHEKGAATTTQQEEEQQQQGTHKEAADNEEQAVVAMDVDTPQKKSGSNNENDADVDDEEEGALYEDL